MFTTMTVQLSTPTLLRLIARSFARNASQRHRPPHLLLRHPRPGNPCKSRTSIPAGTYPSGANSAIAWKTSRIE